MHGWLFPHVTIRGIAYRYSRLNLYVLYRFKNYATYILAIRMAKSPETVDSFLCELNKKLTPLAEKEMAVLLRMKKEDAGEDFDEQSIFG